MKRLANAPESTCRKPWLDVALAGRAERWRLADDASGLAQLVALRTGLAPFDHSSGRRDAQRRIPREAAQTSVPRSTPPPSSSD